jgi:hypothetical protein
MTTAATTTPAQDLLPLTTRVTIGHMICVTEGIIASVSMLFPTDQRFYLFGFLLRLAVWAALDRFRFGKLGADIGDLCFWDAANLGVAGLLFANGVGTGWLWFAGPIISVLKIYRVYVRAGTVTQESGWAIIGPMSYWHAKQTGASTSRHSRWQMYQAFLVACVVGVIVGFGIKLLPDIGRVAANWAIPLWFELVYGPRQVRTLQQFIPAFLASQQPGAATPATPATEPVAGQQQPAGRQLPPEVLASLTEAYFATEVEVQGHLVSYAAKLAESFPADKP